MGIDVIVLDPRDTVAVAVSHLPAGRPVETPFGPLPVTEPIPPGHKIARRAMAPGDPIIKHGMPVGRAACRIEPGAHVHVHNVTSMYLTNRQDHHE